MGQDLEMTPERGEMGLCLCVCDWEGHGLIVTDTIPQHMETRHTTSQGLIPQQSREKHPVILVEKNMPTCTNVLSEKLPE